MAPLTRDGYVVLPGSVPEETLTAYAAERTAARDGLLARRPGAEHVELATQIPDDEPSGAIDPYAIVEAARALLLSPAIVDLLTTAYEGDAPLLFDAAESAASAPDGKRRYRDATFTALADRPDTLITIAVALGPDDTMLTVHPGSQEIETTAFSGRYPAFNSERDGDAALTRHHDELDQTLAASTDTITLHPGDAVAWAAGLVHLPIDGPALVAHVCPTSVAPGWFAYRPERARHAAFDDGAAWLTTQHYDLVDAVALEPTTEREHDRNDDDEPDDAEPTAVQDERELERVESALREHDDELASDTPSPAPPPPTDAAGTTRRQGGLVDSVRGLLGRRARGRDS